MMAVFLDRDGTITEERGHITHPDGAVLIPGAAGAIAELRRRGIKVFIVSNQAGVAKGLMTEDELGAVNRRVVELLRAEGAEVDGIYYCPHHPQGTRPGYAIECDCRKPKPGMLQRAAREHGLDLSRCAMVGDAVRDIAVAKAVGVVAVLVRTGHGAKSVLEVHGADHVAEDLAEAVRWLLSRGETS